MNLFMKLQEHLDANANAEHLFLGNPSMDGLIPSQKRKINELINTGIGYVWRYGDAELVNKLTNTDDIFNKTLLLQLGHKISNKMALQKTSNFLHDKKYSPDYTENVDLKLEHELKAVKESLFKIQMYHVQQRTSGKVDSGDMGLPTDLMEDFQSRISTDINKPISKKNNLQKMKLALDGAIKDKIELEKTIIIQNENVPIQQEVVNVETLNITPNPEVFLRDEAIELELERFAKQNFHLKEVSAKTLEMSLDGDVPRAIITDLSYEQIHSIVESMEERFNGPNANEQMELSNEELEGNGSLLNDLVNAVKPEDVKVKTNTAPQMTTRKLPNGQVVHTRMLPKPQPVANKKKKDKKNAPQPANNTAQYRAAVHTMELAKFYSDSQDYHYNYLEVERFELDEMYVNSVYEAGAKNPYTGRLFNVRYKNLNSDMRYDDRFKRRTV